MGAVVKAARAMLVLGRVSNLPTVWTNCLAAWVLVAHRPEGGAAFALEAPDFLLLLSGASLLYTGGMALNDACDVKWDREHAPGRPIPAGALTAGQVWVTAVAWLALGAGLLLAAKGPAWPFVLALVAAIVLYDVVHKRRAEAVVLMGACRFLLYATAGFVALRGDDPGAMPGRLWVAAAGLFLYIVGVTAAARGERTGGRVPFHAWAMLAAPAIAWVACGSAVPVGGGTVFALLFLGWLGFAAWRLRGDHPARVGRFVGLLLAGIVLVDAMMASMADARSAWVCAACLPLTLLLQRFVPAT